MLSLEGQIHDSLILVPPLQFNLLYELAIDTAERAVVASKRIDNITEHLTYEIFLYFQRGLFERHKIVFALMLAFAVLTSSGKVHS